MNYFFLNVTEVHLNSGPIGFFFIYKSLPFLENKFTIFFFDSEPNNILKI